MYWVAGDVLTCLPITAVFALISNLVSCYEDNCFENACVISH